MNGGLGGVGLDDLYLRAGILKQIIHENQDDPRVWRPKEQLSAIEAEIGARMSEYEQLSDEELEARRGQIHVEIEALRASFKEIGLVLDARRVTSEKVDELEALRRQNKELQKRITGLEADIVGAVGVEGQPPPQRVGLKTLIMRGRMGGKDG